MNSKAQIMVIVKLLIAASLILIFAWLIFKFISAPESQTVNSFKTLGKEIELTIEDLNKVNETSVVVPVYMEEGWTIETIDKEAAKNKELCKGYTCMVLTKNGDLENIASTLKFKDIRFKEPEVYIRSPKGEIIKVKITGEVVNKEKILTVEKI